MKKLTKRIIKYLIILLVMILISLGAYKLYLIVIEDATKRIRQGVQKGVSKGIGDTINPLKWPGKLIGKGAKE